MKDGKVEKIEKLAKEKEKNVKKLEKKENVRKLEKNQNVKEKEKQKLKNVNLEIYNKYFYIIYVRIC